MPTPSFSGELLALLVALSLLARHLVKNAASLPPRRFVALAVLAGALVVAAVGTAFRTMLVTRVVDLPVSGIDDHRLSWIKAVLALGAAALSVHEGKRAAAGEPPRACWSKGIALGLSVIAVGAYFRFGDLGAARFYHGHEFFHYYLGSKYDRELGYKRIYYCVAVAQADSGQAGEVRLRKMMDLGTEHLVPAAIALEHPEACRDRFTPERWEAFKGDVRYFRASSSLGYWNEMQNDHGYNPPPVWTIMGHFWASRSPPTDRYLLLLALFDPLLLAAMFAAIGWAFGWRTLAVAAIFWGCQLPADYYWTGGAFLRQDWLFLLVLSACLVRKRYHALGGAAFAYATLLRIFPGALLFGWLVVAGAHLVRHRRLDRRHLRVALGGLGATVALVAISVALTGAAAYPEFYRHILLHNQAPVTNHMGLKTVMGQSWEGRVAFAYDGKQVDPFARWKAMRRDRQHAFFPLYLVLLAAVAVLFVVIVRRVRSLEVAQALSLLIVAAAVELTCYYYSLFILSALLARRRKGVEAWVLCVAGVSQLLAVNRFLSANFDDRYVIQSLLFLSFALSLLLLHLPRRAARGASLDGRPGGRPRASISREPSEI